MAAHSEPPCSNALAEWIEARIRQEVAAAKTEIIATLKRNGIIPDPDTPYLER